MSVTKLRKAYCWVCQWNVFNWWIFGKVKATKWLSLALCAPGHDESPGTHVGGVVQPVPSLGESAKLLYVEHGKYCSKFVQNFVPARSALRASSSGDLVVPRTRRRIGDKAFSVAAPRAWNTLPTQLKLLYGRLLLFVADWKHFCSSLPMDTGKTDDCCVMRPRSSVRGSIQMTQLQLAVTVTGMGDLLRAGIPYRYVTRQLASFRGP